MTDQDINDWNKKVDKLKEYIEQEFPDGCKNVNCGTCTLSSYTKRLRTGLDHEVCAVLVKFGNYEL